MTKLNWINLVFGLMGLGYLMPPYKPIYIGGALISLGFLVRFVCGRIYGGW